MNDLIRRSDLIEMLTNENEREYTKEAVLQFVQAAPTAYDVDKVVERLEKKDFPDYEEEYSCNGQQMVFLYDAIKIVKDGGTNNKRR